MKHKKYFFWILFLTLKINIFFTFSFAFAEEKVVPSSKYLKDFAILTTTHSYEIVWNKEVESLKAFLSLFGWSSEEVFYDNINVDSNILGVGKDKHYKAIIVPGGLVGPISNIISANGRQNILNFIESGGGYIGFCAGAHLAAKNLEIAYYPTGPNGLFYRPKDYHNNLAYNLLNLFPGKTIGPYDWIPFKKDSVQIVNVKMNASSTSLKNLKLPENIKMLYFGGPFFELDNEQDKPADYEVWGETIAPPEFHSISIRAANKPSIVKFSHGEGNIVLFSQHPVFYGFPQDPILSSNFQSWNILHAAFQTITNEPITSLSYNEIQFLRRQIMSCQSLFIKPRLIEKFFSIFNQIPKINN